MSDRADLDNPVLDRADRVGAHLNGAGRIAERAAAIAKAGGLEQALIDRILPAPVSLTLAEALVLGLLKQGVTKYLAIFGHGSTQIGEVLRVYQEAGLTRTFQFRNEVAMAHAATALSWAYGEIPAVVTSIGPGALQAMAGSLVAASNGVGVYHLYGDETSHGEGYNMQQVPKPLQGAFGMITGLMNRSYTLHTPEALREALRQGIAAVHHPAKPGPFTLMLPINTQPQLVNVSLDALPVPAVLPPLSPADDQPFVDALALINGSARIVIKAGGGARRFADQVRGLAERIGAAVALAPGSTGVLPDAHAHNMHVGG
jgi:3D-(3,5/4)-trihydroxycyclohexane-1,2-dione acylhydrolase (decyclizing)